MSLRGWLDEFPSNWNYSGEAKLVIGNFQYIFKINIIFLFAEEIEIEVKIFWDDISLDKIFDIGDNFTNTSNHKLIVQESLILIGNTYFPRCSSYIQPTEFYVNRIITYEKSFEKTNLLDSFDFCNVRVYLNDQYSGRDDDIISEYINIQRYSKGKYTNVLERENAGLYCQLNSVYKVQCGQQYAIHKDHNIFFDRKNIETLYKSSFIGIEIDKNTILVLKAMQEQTIF